MTTFTKIIVAAKTTTVVTLSGLLDGDMVVVEYLADTSECASDDSGDVWVPFSPGGCQWAMDNKHNPMCLDTPGTYRICPQGAALPNVKIKTVVYPE